MVTDGQERPTVLPAWRAQPPGSCRFSQPSAPYQARLACSPGLVLPTGWGAFGTTLFPSVEWEKL